MLRIAPVRCCGRTAFTCATLATIWLGGSTPAARAQGIGVTIDSKSNIFLAGRSAGEVPAGTHPNGPGSLPPFVSLAPGVGRAIRFDSVTGSVSYNDVDAPATYIGQYNGPDGGAVWFKDDNFPSQFLTTASPPGLIDPAELGPNPSRPGVYPLGSTTFYVDMDPFGGISGMQLFESDPAERRVMFLAGVFLDDADPIGLTAPPSLDFGSGGLGRSFSSLAPGLRQTFYIGDGLTGEGAGATQSFLVPDAATRLFLGIVDGAYFVGGPDYYDNNVGSFSAQVTLVPEIGPESFASAISLAVAVLALGECRRARRARSAA